MMNENFENNRVNDAGEFSQNISVPNENLHNTAYSPQTPAAATPNDPEYAQTLYVQSAPQIPSANYAPVNNTAPYTQPNAYAAANNYVTQNEAATPSFSCEWNSSGAVTQELGDGFSRSIEESKKKEKKSVSKKTPVALLLVLTILISMVFGTGSAYVTYKLLDKANEDSSVAVQNKTNDNKSSTPAEILGKNELTTAEITEYCASSVVEIFTESVQTGMFSQQYIESGAGSGVIIESDGYIVTNHHVINGASRVTVTLRSGESYEAEVVGSDHRMDLAIIKIEPKSTLTVATFGDSDKLVIGERTVAIGNPLGQLGGTVTEGILSALDREMIIDGQKMNLLQTDTAINPGNSGGGLFNAKGELIGIVSAKSTGSEIEGLGFAIPINDVLDVVSDLKEYGYVMGRVDLGMELIDIDTIELMFIYGIYDYGCVIYSVYDGTNAQKAGFRSGDIILEVNSTQVESVADVELIINELNIGDNVTFKVKRGRNQGTIEMTLEEYVPRDSSGNSSHESEVINPYA